MHVGLRLVGATLLAGRRPGRALAAFGEIQAFDRGALLIVIPRFNHDEWQGMGSVEITCIEVERVFEGLATTAGHMPIQAP